MSASTVTVTRYDTPDSPTLWVYLIRRGCEWSKVVVDETGSIFVNGSWGGYAHQWTSFGECIRRFILGCDNGYLAGKLRPDSYVPTVDHDASAESVRRDILEWRRNGDLNAEEARAEWDRLPHTLDDGNVDGWIRETCLADASELLVIQRTPSDLLGFLDHMWPQLREHLRAELEQETRYE